MKTKQLSKDSDHQNAVSHIKTTGVICIGIGILAPITALLRADDTTALVVGVITALWFLWIGIALYRLPSAPKAKLLLILVLISSIVLATGVFPLLSLISSIAALVKLKHYRAWKEDGRSDGSSPLNLSTSYEAIQNYSLALIKSINPDNKLSSKEATRVTFMSLALMYVLVDRQAFVSMSQAKRHAFSDKLHIKIQDYLVGELGDSRRPVIIQLLDTSIESISPYASKLTPSSTDKGLAGTLFWEFGKIMEKQLPESNLSRVEISMIAMEYGGNLLNRLKLSSNETPQGSQSSRKRTALKTFAVVGVAIIALAWFIDVSGTKSQCNDETARLQGVVERSEQYLKETEERAKSSDVAVEYYNKHVPEHNQYVAEYNAKLAECR